MCLPTASISITRQQANARGAPASSYNAVARQPCAIWRCICSTKRSSSNSGRSCDTSGQTARRSASSVRIRMSVDVAAAVIASASPAEQLVLHWRDRTLALAGIQRAVAVAVDQVVDRAAHRSDLDHAQLAGDAVLLELVAALER